ncbi:MAG: hypothetical protein COZ12_06040 [Deltaproteobacteria bacterium CG_4_10_14_3_um_filter_60_8]|nr:MAG: hypothetical protein AUK28_05250 [Desulfobacterales bacterium CG2_30_60_27]PIY21187.1 MAG: hypothetical protein COZ12_06040 [Deltaproteobacteria bacterium CG_4_10_14_3_um_filter_60_8]
MARLDRQGRMKDGTVNRGGDHTFGVEPNAAACGVFQTAAFCEAGMDCGRLEKLIKTWYVQVQDEALAPARMLDFMEKHLADCEVCLVDADVRHEVQRIAEIVLPPAKMRKDVTADEGELAAAATDVDGVDRLEATDASPEEDGDEETEFDD